MVKKMNLGRNIKLAGLTLALYLISTSEISSYSKINKYNAINHNLKTELSLNPDKTPESILNNYRKSKNLLPDVSLALLGDTIVEKEANYFKNELSDSTNSYYLNNDLVKKVTKSYDSDSLVAKTIFLPLEGTAYIFRSDGQNFVLNK